MFLTHRVNIVSRNAMNRGSVENVLTTLEFIFGRKWDKSLPLLGFCLFAANICLTKNRLQTEVCNCCPAAADNNGSMPRLCSERILGPIVFNPPAEP